MNFAVRLAICILILGSQPKLQKERISAASNGESWAGFWNEANVWMALLKLLLSLCICAPNREIEDL